MYFDFADRTNSNSGPKRAHLFSRFRAPIVLLTAIVITLPSAVLAKGEEFKTDQVKSNQHVRIAHTRTGHFYHGHIHFGKQPPGGNTSPPPSNPGPPGPPALTLLPPAGWLNIVDFGAVGDAVTDNQAAISNAIAQARATGMGVYVPPGSFAHSQILAANSVQITGAGSSSVLIATNNAAGAIQLSGNNTSISNLVLSYASPAAAPFYAPNLMDPYPAVSALWIASANVFAVSQVTILNSDDNAIDVDQSSNGSISSVKISGTADAGIELVDCYNVQVVYCAIQGVGTSPLYVKSNGNGSQYLTIGANQLVGNPFFDMTLSGFSNSTVGSNSISAATLDIFGNGGAGNYGPVNNVVVSNNALNNSGADAISVLDLTGTDTYVTNLQITGNSITNAALNGIEVGSANTVFILSNTINTVGNSVDMAAGVLLLTCSGMVVQGNVISNTSDSGILVDAERGSGSVALVQNALFACGTGYFPNTYPYGDTVNSPESIIYFNSAGNYNGLTIANNSYSNPSKTNVQYYIWCPVPGSFKTVSGNTTTPHYPSSIAP